MSGSIRGQSRRGTRREARITFVLDVHLELPRQPYLVEISNRKVKGHFNLKGKIKLGNADSGVAVHMVDGSHRMNEINHR